MNSEYLTSHTSQSLRRLCFHRYLSVYRGGLRLFGGVSISGGVSVQGGHCPCGLCAGGLCAGGLCAGGLCPGGGVPVHGRGVTVQGDLCPGMSLSGGGLCHGYPPPYFNEWAVFLLRVFLKKNLEGISPFCGASDIPVLDFWWRLLWVSKPEWPTLFCVAELHRNFSSIP